MKEVLCVIVVAALFVYVISSFNNDDDLGV